MKLEQEIINKKEKILRSLSSQNEVVDVDQVLMVVEEKDKENKNEVEPTVKKRRRAPVDYLALDKEMRENQDKPTVTETSLE